MRVISQDRDYSVDFDRTPFWCQSQCIYAKIGGENVLFAAYKSKDRMKEVFQEMHDIYSPEPFQMPYFGSGSSFDDGVTLLENMARITPAVLEVSPSTECICNSNMVYYLPEE